MIYVSKTMGIYTIDANRAMEIAREILEKEGKQNIQVFNATPPRLEGDMGYKVNVSYYEYTDKENYEINLNKAKETIKENFVSLQDKVEDTMISRLSGAIDEQINKINKLYQRGYISSSEASNYLHDLLEIITSITHSLLLSYESTNVKIFGSDNSIVLDYYRTCINVEYPIEIYIRT